LYPQRHLRTPTFASIPIGTIPAPTFDAGICGPRINGRMIWSLIRLAVVPKAMPNGSAWAGQVDVAAAPIVALPAEFSPVDKGAC
jgi:hypothetical protein